METPEPKPIDPIAVKEVIGGILSTARRQRMQSARYQAFVDIETRNGVAGMLKEAEQQMTALLLDVVQVLEEKYGILSNDAYTLLSALPLLQDRFEELVIEEQGHRVDCYPKSYTRLATTVLCMIADRDGFYKESLAARKGLCEGVEQRLTETMADFLDNEDIQRWQVLYGFRDPQPTEKSELHIRMAKAALAEYKATMTSK